MRLSCTQVSFTFNGAKPYQIITPHPRMPLSAEKVTATIAFVPNPFPEVFSSDALLFTVEFDIFLLGVELSLAAESAETRPGFATTITPARSFAGFPSFVKRW